MDPAAKFTHCYLNVPVPPPSQQKEGVPGLTDFPPQSRLSWVSQPGLILLAPAPAASMFLPVTIGLSRSCTDNGGQGPIDSNRELTGNTGALPNQPCNMLNSQGNIALNRLSSLDHTIGMAEMSRS